MLTFALYTLAGALVFWWGYDVGQSVEHARMLQKFWEHTNRSLE